MEEEKAGWERCGGGQAMPPPPFPLPPPFSRSRVRASSGEVGTERGLEWEKEAGKEGQEEDGAREEVAATCAAAGKPAGDLLATLARDLFEYEFDEAVGSIPSEY
jgi:hypothetical protein